jgi:putative hydroxymethylpyrimidine transport system ATP-binding protein
LRFIAGLTTQDERSQGTITVDNDIPITQQIAYMAQTDCLLPWLNAHENIMLGFKLRGQTGLARKSAAKEAHLLMEKVGLKHAASLYPAQLSGGMRQRVALVRTLIENQPIILMDEPFSALDAVTRYRLQNLAATLLKNKTVLFITHDPLEALRLADEIYVMHGAPATLQLTVKLTSPTPRDPSHDEIIHWQTKLFNQLLHATNEAA